MTSPSSPATRETGTDKLLVEVADAVAVVTLNNPAKRNALSSDMRAALPGLLEALQADAGVRVVVLTGAGDKAFASGADISEFADMRTSPAARAQYDRIGETLSRSWASLGASLHLGTALRHRSSDLLASLPSVLKRAHHPRTRGSKLRLALP